MEVKPYDGAAAPLGVSLRFSLSLPLATAAQRGLWLALWRHKTRPLFGGLVLCGVADGHIKECFATTGAHIRLDVVRLKTYCAGEGIVVRYILHQFFQRLSRVYAPGLGHFGINMVRPITLNLHCVLAVVGGYPQRQQKPLKDVGGDLFQSLCHSISPLNSIS